MVILFVGDIFGSSGRKILAEKLPEIRREYGIDLVIANAENSAHGKGLTPKIYRNLMACGVDFFTMGNHTWFRREGLPVLGENNIVRPLNLSEDFIHSDVGRGSREFMFNDIRVRVTNLLGSSVKFKGYQTNPFVEMARFLGEITKPDIHIVDFHAETTSEKYAFLWAFDGQVDVVVGTHTHVPTNDALITPNGTAFICDVGMTGPSQGIIGGERTSIIRKFFDPDSRFILEVQGGGRQICSLLIKFDPGDGCVTSVNPLIIREGLSNEKPKPL